MLRYGSLCTGYDGIGLGLEMAGVDIDRRFFAELEPSMSGLLAREYPDVPNVGDIKTADWSPFAGQIDILSSGDPCQSISVAGRQAGREDPRFLWPWVREAIQAIEPSRIVLENVENMVAHDDGQTMAERFRHLREDGYSVRWAILGACSVGAAHHRHRWFAVADRVGGPVPEAVRLGGRIAVCGAPMSGGRALMPTPISSDVNGGVRPGPERRRSPNLRDVVNMLPTPAARDALPRGMPSREAAERREANTSRSRNIEDAVALLPTPTATNSHGNTVNSRGEPLLPGVAAELLPAPRATVGPIGGPGSRGSSGDLAMPSACQPQNWGKYAAAVALWEQVTGTPAPAPTVPGPKGGVRLNPELPEWMMGLCRGLLTDGQMTRNEALRAAGNGVVPHAMAAAWNLLTDEENGLLW